VVASFSFGYTTRTASPCHVRAHLPQSCPSAITNPAGERLYDGRDRGRLTVVAARYAAVLFDLLTGLLDSWSLWDAVARDEGTGRRWRTAYLRRVYAVERYRPYQELVAEAARDQDLDHGRSRTTTRLRSWRSRRRRCCSSQVRRTTSSVRERPECRCGGITASPGQGRCAAADR
jgi:hypothetical protein